MRALLKIWLVILAGAGIGVVLTRDSGYVLLSFGNYTVEMSLALLLLLLVMLFVLLYFVIRTLVRTFHLPRDLREWKHRRVIAACWRCRRATGAPRKNAWCASPTVPRPRC